MKRENPSFLRSLGIPVMLVGLFALAAGQARAAGLSPKESEDLRQARQLYKSGKYQEAADIFSRLSSAHPDIPAFGRNAGAAYYYLKRPDPALSNLREYLRVEKNLKPEDREEVDKWIAEMEKLRAQATTSTPAVPAVPAATPAAGPAPTASGSAPSVGQPAAPAQPGAPSGALPPGYPPTGYYPYGVPPGQPQPVPGYPPGYAYPPPGGPGPMAAPGSDPTAATPTGPAGQPYPPAYPSNYAQPYPVQPAAPVPPAAQEEAVQKTRTPEKSAGPLPWIIGGAGVATLALGGVFTYLYRSAFDDTLARYDPDRESAGKTYSYLQFVCYGLGAAGVTTAAILLFKSGGSSGETTVSVAPALGPQLAGAELMVRY